MATKGWSFGALTAALKSAAFVDASVNAVAGQVPIFDPNNNLLIASKDVANGNGLVIFGPGPKRYRTFIGNVRDTNGAVPNNWFSQMFQAELEGDKVEFGLVRASGDSAIGYGTAQNGTMVHQYMKATARHKFAGVVYTRELNLGPDDTDTTGNGSTRAYLKTDSATQISLGHTTHNWAFQAGGGIASGSITGDEYQAGLRCQPGSGTWEDGVRVTAGLQIDLTGTGASVIWRATLWGNRHVAFMQAAFTENKCVSRWVAGGAVLTLQDINANGALSLSQGGIYAPKDIVSGGTVQAGSGSGTLLQDGNLNGSQWGNNYLSNWLNNNFANDRNEINNRVHEMRWTNERYRSTGQQGVITRSSDNGDDARISDLQYFKNTTGWVTVGWS